MWRNRPGLLDEDFLEPLFSKSKCGEDLGPNYTRFHESHSHWNEVGRYFVGLPVAWTPGRTTSDTFSIDGAPANVDWRYRKVAIGKIEKRLEATQCPMFERTFRRVLADRDIKPEPAKNEMSLGFDGTGATNIIRRFINSSSHPEDLIQVKLLSALDAIFGTDGKFDRIEIREHDESSSDEETNKLWEVFLGEPTKGLVPLSGSGSGLKTVILVLLNLLVIPELEDIESSQYVFAFEELENNLHPALLRRLMNYLGQYVENEKCFLFLTTHSNVSLDCLATRTDTQIVHVRHDGKSASAETIETHFDQVSLLTELGSRPSDLLQANGVIWLEGPSDRIYFNRFIDLFSGGTLREGREYQCAFYGGSVLANMTFGPPETGDASLTNLLRLNHNIAVICDGDRTAQSGTGSRIKSRVTRIKQEIEQIPDAFLWITQAKEIENYIPGRVWSEIYKRTGVPNPTKFDTFPSSNLKSKDFVKKRLQRSSFDKCDFATKAVAQLTRKDLEGRFEFKQEIEKLVKKIRVWNQ